MSSLLGGSRQPGGIKRGSGTWVGGWREWVAWVGGQQWVVRWAEASGDNGHLNVWREVGGWVMGWKMTEGWMALGGMLGG